MGLPFENTVVFVADDACVLVLTVLDSAIFLPKVSEVSHRKRSKY